MYDADRWETQPAPTPPTPAAGTPAAVKPADGLLTPTGETVVRLIDFAKVVPLEPGRRLTHRDAWQPGNREDGAP